MSIIDKTYLTRSLSVGQLSGKGVSQTIDEYIALYEPKYLLDVLGGDLYAEYITNPDDPKFDLLKPQTTPIVYKLTCSCSSCAIGGLWYGLSNDLKVSPIANLVYYHYTKDKNENMMGVGNVASIAESSYRMSPARKMEVAWNQMVDMTRGLLYLLNEQGVITTSCSCKCPYEYINSFNI